MNDKKSTMTQKEKVNRVLTNDDNRHHAEEMPFYKR